jgi:nucleoside-diphosphate-sugar epimerase
MKNFYLISRTLIMPDSKKRILLTGATGFIGKELANRIEKDGYFKLRVIVRRDVRFSIGTEVYLTSSLVDNEVIPVALRDVEVLIHSAARAHIMKDQAFDPLAEYRKTNTEDTLKLARMAAISGVRRFIFISSIKVNGEGTADNQRYTADDIPAPVDAYGISKMEAEQGLFEIASKTKMEVVIIRPVLVYGPGVKANFHNMMRWLNKSIPLPFGAIQNKRSILALDNLVDLVIVCTSHPNAANQIFLASDGIDISTSELLREVSQLLKKTPLIPIPTGVIIFLAGLLGKTSFATRLCGSLQVDINKTQELLNWFPPIATKEALKKTTEYFLKNNAL